jgi:hypothetical protein
VLRGVEAGERDAGEQPWSNVGEEKEKKTGVRGQN